MRCWTEVCQRCGQEFAVEERPHVCEDCAPPVLTLDTLQKQVKEWAGHNCPHMRPREVAGEIAVDVQVLKRVSRGWRQGLKTDVIAHAVIALAHYAMLEDINLQECVTTAWESLREMEGK